MSEEIAATTSQTVATDSGFRDRDPPPSFDGTPEKFKQFLRELRLWQHETDIPVKKHGAKLVRQLSGAAKAAADEVPVEEVVSEQGVEHVLKKLREHYQPHLETSMPKAFEKAVYGESRRAREPFGEYIIRMEAGFRELQDEGVKLGDDVKGYIIYRQANLSQAQDDQIVNWAQGKYERSDIIKALRKLEKVTKERGVTKNYATTEVLGSDAEVEESWHGEMLDDDDDQYVYLAEQDLNDVYGESELTEALATYQQVRKAIRDQKTGRGDFQPKISASIKQSSGGSSGTGKGGGSGARIQVSGKGARVHVDVLKLRTRRARCGQVGHWARECRNEPDARAKSKAQSSAQSNHTGFFELGHHEESNRGCMLVRERALPSFGEIVRASRKQECHENMFNALTTESTHGIVDTAAQGGLIGESALNRLSQQLKARGLQVRWSSKPAQAHGIGGAAEVRGVAGIPVGIGGVNGLIEATVVKEEVPFLLSIKFLKDVDAVVNLPKGQLELSRFGATTPLMHLPSGHVAVDVLNFPNGVWNLPHGAPRKESEFRCFSTGFLVSEATCVQFPMQQRSSHTFLLSDKSHGSFAKNQARKSGFPSSQRAQLKEGHLSLESHSKQAAGIDRFGGGSGTGFKLARRWIKHWLVLLTLVGCCDLGTAVTVHSQLRAQECQGPDLQGAHQDRRSFASEEEQDSTTSELCHLHSSSRFTGGSGQSVAEGDMLQKVPSTLAGGSRGDGSAEVQGRDQEEDTQPTLGTHLAHCEEAAGQHAESGILGQDDRGGFGGELHSPSLRSTAEHSSSRAIHSSDGLCSELPMWEGSRPSDSEEGRTHEGQALLQVSGQAMQLLRVGRHRSSGASAGTEASTSNSNQVRGDDTGSREETHDSNGGAEDSIQRAGAISAGPNHVAHSFGRRGEDQSGDGKPRGTTGGHQSGFELAGFSPRLGRGPGDTGVRQQSEADAMKSAPWACHMTKEGQWRKWTKFQLEDEEAYEHQRRVMQGAWIKNSSQSCWEFHHGILPDFQEGNEAIGAFVTNTPEEEEAEMQGMSRHTAKRIKKGMRQLRVAEVYSQPRLSKEAEEHGHVGVSFDIKNGFDFSTARDRRRCWQQLRELDPDVVLVCPPCGPFSILQELNYGKMNQQQAMLKLGEGIEHLRFAMKVLKWQYNRGKLGIFEHPSTSRAWQEQEVEEIWQMPGVQRVRADQCEYGLAVPDHRGVRHPNKKPTDFMVNGKNLARWLSKRCSKQHQHKELMGGLAIKAQEYPKALCQAMIKGAEEDAKEVIMSVFLGEEDDEDLEDMLEKDLHWEEAADPHKEAEDPHEEKNGVTREEVVLLKKLHCNMGHPSNIEFSRALRMARARPEIWKYAKQKLVCKTCESTPRPKSARPAQLPKNFEACRAVGVDVVFMPAMNVRENVPVLNMVDLATSYQMLEPLQNMHASHVWEKFMSTWCRTFGMPDVILLDQGREFSGQFAARATDAGALLRVIGARAPWQNGKTERHGGIAKEVFHKVREEMLPTTEEEWLICLREVESSKNRMFNKTGFSPAQRQIGYNVRLPGSMMSEDPYDPEMLILGSSAEMRRKLDIRQKAMEVFVKQNTQEAIARAALARKRTVHNLQPGEVVYVYRIPLQKRRRKGVPDPMEDQEGRRPMWVGPGMVLMIEGANAWVSIRGEVWKCAHEQLRRATEEEIEAKELLKEEFEELQIQLNRKDTKRQYRDISRLPMPEDEEEEPPLSRPRVDSGGGRGGGSTGSPQDPTEQSPQVEEPTLPPAAQAATPTISEGYTPSIQTTQDEPEEEALAPAVVNQAMESVRRNEILDGTIGKRGDEAMQPRYEAIRRHARERWRPYQGEQRTVNTLDDPEEEEAEDQDLWVYDEERNVLIREHNVERNVKFTPSSTRGCPVPTNLLCSEKKVYQYFGDHEVKCTTEHWRRNIGKTKEEQGPQRWWIGYTEFKLRKPPKNMSYVVKKGSDEVKEEDIKEEEWEAWKVTDREEWSKVEATGAVKTLSMEESQDVLRQLKEAGLEKRILPSRMVRRWKPAEQPGAPATRKSRWCIRGDQDPDLLDLSRHAPTINTATLSVVLQTAASLGWDSAIGDLRNAFMQSDKLQRPSGRLFCRQPRGGLSGLQEGQLIEILAGAYGLGDAPAHWRRSLRKVLFEMQLVQSLMDPCIYKWFQGSQLCGLVVVEVDDLFLCGSAAFFKHMSCVLNVLHGGTKQGKAYAAAYALLTRAQVLLTHVIVPYADLTRTIFSTSPQFRLTRSNFYMQESKQWLAKSSSGRWRRGRRGRRWWRSTTSRSSPSTKLTYAQLTRRLRGPYADVRKQLPKTPTEDNQYSFKKRHSNA